MKNRPRLVLNRGEAFTLIELLVVVAIMALLASMILPVLNSAKRRAETAICQANLRQWSIGLTLYLADYSAYPLAITQPGGRFWFETLEPYTGNRWRQVSRETYGAGAYPKGIHACPAYTRLKGNYFGASGSYGYNVSGILYKGLGAGEGGGVQPRPETEVVSPSEMIAIGDAIVWKPNGKDFEGNPFLIPLMPGSPALFYPAVPAAKATYADTVEFTKARHGGRWNILFCDGHIEPLKTEDLFNIQKPAARSRWNVDNKPYMNVPLPF